MKDSTGRPININDWVAIIVGYGTMKEIQPARVEVVRDHSCTVRPYSFRKGFLVPDEKRKGIIDDCKIMIISKEFHESLVKTS